MSLKPCCATGEIHTGTPTGTIKTLHGVTVYVAEPPSSQGPPKGIIVVLPDAFGWDSPNSRILADAYATKASSLVYLPELMRGYALPPSALVSTKAMSATGLWATFKKLFHMLRMFRYIIPFLLYNRPSAAQARVFDFFKKVRLLEARRLPVGVAGFCWGGWFVAQLCRDRAEDRVLVDGSERPLVDCGYTAHPSFWKLPHDVEQVVKPLSVAAGEKDSTLKEKDRETIRRVFEKKNDKDDAVEHELVVYEGAGHGFAVRGSETDENENEQGRLAETQAVDWFSRWFIKWSF